MPPFPPQPAGQIQNPPAPQILPIRDDFVNAIEYNKQLRVSCGVSCVCFCRLICLLFPSLGAGIATRDDVARGAVYELAVITEHTSGDIGMSVSFKHDDYPSVCFH